MAAPKLILMVVVLVLLTFVEQTKSHKRCRGYPSAFIICEHTKAIIACPHRRKLHILRASYGRHTRKICPHRRIRTTSCHARKSLLKVRSACNRRSACHIRASNSVFGDPCRGTFKYLYVSYICC